MPAGLVQIVCGEGADVGPAIIDGADFVMFTGSTATGRFVGERAGANLIDCTLELGGKNPLVVMPDADLDEVVPGAIFATFLNAGQACMHIERIYVPEELAEQFTRRFVIEAAEARPRLHLRLHPADGCADQHPAPRAGLEPRRGRPGQGRRGAHRRPCPARPGADLLRAHRAARGHQGDGPRHRGDLRARRHDRHLPRPRRGVGQANDTEYGLNASIWGSDFEAAEAFGRRINAGNININDGLAASYASKASPSGGIKSSGVGARHGDAGMLKYTDPINVAVLKKQVLTSPPDLEGYLKHMKQTKVSLRAMRKLGIR